MPVSALPQERLVSLDVFRGATIVAMILVNNPGSWAAIYGPLRHAAWHGWTPTDLIFPFFLFIVGVSVVLAYQKRLARGETRASLMRKGAKRAGVLFLLGLLMAAYPFFVLVPEVGWYEGLVRLRIPGVLQRIALCYLGVSALFLYTRPRTWWLVGGGVLLGYWALLTWVPVPGYGAGLLGEGRTTLAGYLDRLLLGEHLWAQANREWDPEGVLSTLPALVTTLLGVVAGTILTSQRTPEDRTIRLFLWGGACLTLGYLWGWVFPINKSLWTSSFVLFTGGQAFGALAACYWLVDVQGYQGWAKPFVVYGVNALTVFVLSGILAKTLYLLRFPTADGTTTLKAWLYGMLFVPLGPPKVASLLYALVWILGWYGVLAWMYRRRWFIKV